MWPNTKDQVRQELNLDQLPDDELMELRAELAQRADSPIPTGPDAAIIAEEYTPEQIRQILSDHSGNWP